MKFEPLSLKGAYLIRLEPHFDERGWFARTYSREEFKVIGHNSDWVQLNHSFTIKKGALRGLHFQRPPFEEIKLVRCIAGEVLDVVVDIRKGSPTFLKWTSVNLTAQGREMIYIPEGFAHGFQTLTDNAELIYHHSEAYHPGAEGGLRFDDHMLGIDWPLPVSEISRRDLEHTYLTPEFIGI